MNCAAVKLSNPGPKSRRLHSSTRQLLLLKAYSHYNEVTMGDIS